MRKSEDVVQLAATVVPPPAAMPPASLDPGEFPDSILVDGNLLTMDAARPSAQVLAIKNGLMMQLGEDATIRSLAGAATQVIDLDGKAVTPGMIDAHNHLQTWSNLLLNYTPLIPPDVKTLEALLAKFSEAVAKATPGDWVQGYFWVIDPLPTIHELDPISPDNPVWILQQGGHYACTNSKGLALAGITRDTKDPEGGVIARDESGEPTGVLYNHRAMDMVRAYIPQPTIDDYVQGMRHSEELMAAGGVTTYHDNNARFSLLEAYMKAAEEKKVLLRGQIFYTVEWPADLERALNEIPYHSDEFIRFAGYKFLIDGQFPTWYTHEPHPGIRWNMPTWDKRMFKKAIKTLHQTGLQISVHCGGDASVDLTLDAFEEAMDANPRPDPRHRIEHASLTKPHASQRAADLGVIISCQPQFLRFSPGIPEKLGEERAARCIVTREWLDAGITLALGSDTPSSPWYQPQATLMGAVTRLGPDDIPFHPEQAMTIQEALYAHTMGSARAAFEENVKGSLTPGKYADLAVWDQDYTAIDPMNIGDVLTVMTILGGKTIYQSSGSA